MGYKCRKNNVGYLTAKIYDPEVVQKVRDHCRHLNIGTSEFIEQCVKHQIENERAMYLQTLSKEELVNMILNKKE